jgi:hypothetical protein
MSRNHFCCLFAIFAFLQISVYADQDDMCSLNVTYQRSGNGGYDINPEDGYDQIEYYTIYAVHEYPEADSIVAQFDPLDEGAEEVGTILNQTLSFTVHDDWSFYDYFVLHIERHGLESTDEFYRAFTPGDTILIQDSNTFDFYKDWGEQSWWVGDFGRYCTLYYEENYLGENQVIWVDLNWGTCDPEMDSGPLLDVHILSPESMCILWDDSSTTNESYKLDVIRWKESEGVWGDSIHYTLPGDYSGFCVNDLHPETFYSFQLYPIDENGQEGEIRQCIHKTIPVAEITDTDLFHYLPYAPVSGYASEGNLGAYAFVYGWDYGENGSAFYHHLLIKREDGSFSVYTIHKGNDGFNVTDIEIVGNQIYVAHTHGDLWRVTLEHDATYLREMALDFEGGYPKQLEHSGDRLYMAVKLNTGPIPAALSSGKQQVPGIQRLGPRAGSSAIADLGIFDLNTETLRLELHTDPYLFGQGADLISVGSEWVWLARNSAVAGGGYESRVFAIKRDAGGLAKFEWPLETPQSRAGIIDMKVNPVTGELIYLSPVYGFCGSFGTDYNQILDPPAGLSHNDIGCFLFNTEGQLVVRDKEGASTFYSFSTYDAIVSNAPLEWDEYQTQPQTLMTNVGPLALVLTKNPPAELVIGGLLLVAGYLNLVQSQNMASQQITSFNLGMASAPAKTTEVVDDLKKFREALRRMSANKMLFDPGEDPGNHPFLTKLAVFTAVVALTKIAISAHRESREKQCEITDTEFTSEYYEWDEYYPLVTNGIEPFNSSGTANCECVGAVYSKFLLVERIEGDQHYKEVYVSAPIQSQDVAGIDFAPAEQMFASLDECYTPEFFLSGLISYGPWKHIDTNGADQANYFLVTDRSFGQEPYGLKGEYLSSGLYFTLQDWIASKTNITTGDFYFSVIGINEDESYHPNFPAPVTEFNSLVLPLEPMLKQFWRFDYEVRQAGLEYFKDPAKRGPYECVFDPETHLLKSTSTGHLVGNASGNQDMVMACNQRIYMNHYQNVDADFHSQFLGGGAVLTAGQLLCIEGQPLMINNFSGHYNPSLASLERALIILGLHGYHEITRKPNVQMPHAVWDIYLAPPLANTSSSIETRLINDNDMMAMGLVTSLYDESQTEYASNVELFLGDTPYTATEILPSSEPTFLFTLPFSDLQNYRGLFLQGLCGTDTLQEFVDYALINPGSTENDTLGNYPYYVHWVPASENASLDQTVCMLEFRRETMNEPPIGERLNFMVSIAAEQQVNGKLRFRFVGQDSYSSEGMTIVHKVGENQWNSVPTQLDAKGEFFETTIDENGLYALISTKSPSPPTFSIYAHLQGPYLPESNTMRNDLAASGDIPYQSPFDESYIPFEGIPDSLVDWMWLELLPEIGAQPAWQTSVLLSQNGWLCSPDGESVFGPSLEGDSYYIRLSHRNHLPTVSGTKLVLRAGAHSVYYFSSSESRFHDSTPGRCLEEGLWGITAGDMNQDGQITTRDYVIWYNQKSLSSEGGLWYLDGDLNLDGVVDDQDFQIWQQNSRIPEPENTQ